MNDLFNALFSPHTTANDFNRIAGQGMTISDIQNVAQAMIQEGVHNIERANDALAKGMRGEGGYSAYKGRGLSKADEQFIGTQLQGQAFNSTTNSNSNLAPIVPQSMSGDLVDLTIDPDEVWLSKHLTKVPVYGLIHERAVQTATSNRPFKTNFIAEGGAGSNAAGSYARRIVQIRFEADRDEISDVAMLVRAATETGFVNRGAMEVVRKASLARLLKGRERNLWLGNNSCDPRSYDGFLTSIGEISFSAGALSVSTDSGRVTNLAGAQITFDALLSVCETKYSPIVGRNSKIKHIVMLPRAHASLMRQAQAAVRYDGGGNGAGAVGNTGVTIYAERLFITASYGKVELVSAPMIMGEYLRNSSTTAGGTDPGVIGAYTPTAASNAASLFTAADAGDYWYRVTGVGANGETAPQTAAAAVTVAAGDSVTIEVGTTQTNIDYYVVERSPKGASNANNSRLVFTWPKNTSGAGSITRIIDSNIIQANTSPVAFMTGKAGDYEFDQLLPLFFKPLAQTGTTFPFLMLDFGAPFWIAPEQQHLILNAGFSA